MSDAIITITDRARGVLAFDKELQAILQRIDAELEDHAITIAAEQARHARSMAVLRRQQAALEQAIYQLGAN